MSETNETRFSALETVIDGLMVDAHAQKLVLRALIATHPHPLSAKAAYQVLCADSEHSFSDSAFSVGMGLGQAQTMGANLRKALEEWTADFPLKAPGRDMP